MLKGYQLLRWLRKQRGETLENTATDASIDCRGLSNIELGITQKPTRQTLHAILTALDRYAPVSMEEWCAVYTAYGYYPPYPLPMETEIAEACRHWRAECGHIPHPAYLIDTGQRLLAWNALAPRLVGLYPADWRTQQFRNATSFDLAFGLAQRFVVIENATAYQQSFVHTLKRELRPYVAVSWSCYDLCIAAAQRRYPEFKRLWEATPVPEAASPTGQTIPLELRLAEYSGALTFQRTKIPFVGDARFQTVLWLPLDRTSSQICLAWAYKD